MSVPIIHPHVYPASRIAAALGVGKRSVLLCLRHVPAASRVSVAGQQADAWTFNDLPEELRSALLERLRQVEGYRDVSHLLASPPPAQDPLPVHAPMQQLEWRDIRERVASFKDAARPTATELEYLWVDVFDAYEAQIASGKKPKRVKRALLTWLFGRAPFLGATYKALDHKFTRRLARWRETGGNPEAVADQRKTRSGKRSDFTLPEADRLLLTARAAELQGNVAMAWRGLIGGWRTAKGESFSQETRAYYASKAASKSYVPARIRDAVAMDVQLLLNRHQGPRCDKLNGAYVNRDPNTYNAGDWFQADDATLEIYFWDEGEDGQPFVTRGQWIPMIDCRTFLILGFVLTPTNSYNAFHIRNLMTIVAERWGLPRKGYYYEGGLWKRSKLIVGPKAEAVGWDETCMGLRGRLGLKFVHARLPRAKVIERLLGIIQAQLTDRAGWASNDEQKKRPEKLKEQLNLIESGKVHPSEFLYSHAEWCQQLEKVCAQFNAEQQNGKYLPGLSPREGFEKFFGTEPMAKLPDDCRYLLANEKHRLKVGRNGITLRYGKRVFNYKSEITGELEGQQVIAWFSSENPDTLSVTDAEGKNPFVVAQSTAVPGMEADNESLERAMQENAAHNSYRRALYRTIAGHLSANFTQRMFRQNITDRKTTELGQVMRQQQTQFAEAKQTQASRARAVQRSAQELGIPYELVRNATPEQAQAIELMKAAYAEQEKEEKVR